MVKQLLRVLLIDDSPEDAELVVYELKKEFNPVHTRVDKAQALQDALNAQTWDLVISDFVMPQFSGLAALKIVQSCQLDLPFIIISGNVGEEIAVEAMKAGAHDYLIKDKLTRLNPAVNRELKEAAVRRERRQAEEALHSSQVMFRSLVEQSLVGIFILQNENFIYVNPKFSEIFGYSQNEIISSKSLVDLLVPEHKSYIGENLLTGTSSWTSSIHYYFQGLRKDLTIIELEAHSSRMMFNGEPAIIGTLLDITERKRAEEELRKLSRAVEQSPVSVVITDNSGTIEYVNPKFTAVTGYTADETLGRNPRMLKSGTISADQYHQLWNTITSGHEWHGEFHNRRKSGEMYWESASISAVRNKEGVITHFISIKEDITERKKEIEHLRQAQKMEAVGRLAGGISHDFNNLLTIINGYSMLILRSITITNPLRREIEHILHAGERAAELTRQLLTFSRQQIIEPKTIQVNDLVKNLQKMLCRLIGEQYKLKTSLCTETGWIKADPGQVEQIIMNLIVNARDAMENGGEITIETGNGSPDDFDVTDSEEAPLGHVFLRVTDKGTGISEDVKAKIFEPFFTTKEQGKGTGLGLATVYGIVQQSGGFINITSLLNLGSTFTVFLPRVLAEEKENRKIALSDYAPPGSFTILAVEDEPGVLQLVATTLCRHGYQVLQSTNAAEAFEIFGRHHEEIDLLLTDVVMPAMSGIQLAELLRQKKRHLRVLFMSGHMDNTVANRNIIEDGYSFVAKPFVNTTLLEKVGQVLGNMRL